MRYINPLTALAMLAAAPVHAQSAATIDPGMTQPQVVERLGKPLSERTYGSFTYLFYKNGCEKKCGMNDLVVLDSNKVVDAVFRSSARKYSGESSSPHMISAVEARRGSKSAPMNMPATKPPSKPGADSSAAAPPPPAKKP